MMVVTNNFAKTSDLFWSKNASEKDKMLHLSSPKAKEFESYRVT